MSSTKSVMVPPIALQSDSPEKIEILNKIMKQKKEIKLLEQIMTKRIQSQKDVNDNN